jgi:hypothetical protein
MKNRRRLLSTGLTLSLLAAFAFGYLVRARAAGVPATAPLIYSGVLTDMNGTPLTGTKNILLQLYSVATAGTALCNSAPAVVTLVGGAFQVALADNCTAVVHGNPDLWIDVLVDGASIGRAKLGAVPYAIEADHAVSATSATTATTAQTATTIAAGPVAGSLTVYTAAGSPAVAAPCAAIIGTSVVDCTCPAGSFVVSGGGDAGSGTGHFIRESRATLPNVWRVTCATAAGPDALCATYHLLCSRIGP